MPPPTPRAFAVVHESGHVIGDVNHGNLVVAADATVKLIDCDSFQVNGKGRRWLCEVGVATHQPPEFQSLTSYRGVVRTGNHDNFGLAVILFQLLFMARHPFSGRYLGSGDMPIERAIREYRFAYGAGALGAEMKSPPGSLALSGVTPALAQLFERAFAREGSRDGGRPKPEAWIAAFQELARRLRKCPANAAHEYYGALAKCPWCEIETRGGFVLFPVVLMPGAAGRPGRLDVAALWQEMRAIPDPGPVPPLPTPAALAAKPARVSPRARHRRRRALLSRVLAVGLALVALGALAAPRLGLIALWEAAVAAVVLLLCAAILFLVRRDGKAELLQAAEKARAQWAVVARRWTSEAGDDPFTERRMALEKLRADYERLPHERLRRLRDLETNREGALLTTFLDRCPLDGAQIKGCGNAKITTLQSYGIETAADIVDHRVLAVPGFGPVLLKRLKAWRHQQEARFVFDPKKGISSTDKGTVEQRFLAEKMRLERALADGVAQLAVLGKERLACRKALAQEAHAAAAALLAAETDLGNSRSK